MQASLMALLEELVYGNEWLPVDSAPSGVGDEASQEEVDHGQVWLPLDAASRQEQRENYTRAIKSFVPMWQKTEEASVQLCGVIREMQCGARSLICRALGFVQSQGAGDSIGRLLRECDTECIVLKTCPVTVYSSEIIDVLSRNTSSTLLSNILDNVDENPDVMLSTAFHRVWSVPTFLFLLSSIVQMMQTV